ncbi:carbohydrate ABC transporter membrane protein 1 (CUT1 family) [Hydrogenispora ethanolica]|uniref:Carbohydrate ABC transporter membrane protein 1 (CUT1 family) n=1 Tax=Hydrogenispora ethanolica TaxID=1082276 RepID=A0A4R1RAV3_HYDET|nr:sugar ABC transporter permease [Hydrogenispora ethanolica]TCL62552.1 carbohydrate ABC transporter membrane protein 1 (CUT1 family) [Hydrogenispora ethanolica]
MYEEKTKQKSLGIFALFGLLPLLAFVIVVMIPFISGLLLSLTNWKGVLDGIQFIGLGNYAAAIKDPGFWASMQLTVVYVLFVTILTNVLAFLLASLVTSGFKGQNLCRTGYFTPNLIGGVILGFIWQFIFTRVFVFIGQTLDIGLLAKNWLTVPQTALWTLILVSVWQNAGYMMLVYVAGLMGIDKSLLEASQIDGASSWQRLLRVKLPLMVPAFTITLFLTLRRAFMVYDVNLSLTKGGPYNSTQLIAMHVYNDAFVNQNLGPGQAKAFLLFAIVAAVAMLQVYILKNKEVDSL